MICVGCVFVGSGRAILYAFTCERQGVLFFAVFSGLWGRGFRSGSASSPLPPSSSPFLLLGSAWAALLFFCLCCCQDCRSSSKAGPALHMPCLFLLFLFSSLCPAGPPLPCPFLSFSFFLSFSLSCMQALGKEQSRQGRSRLGR